MFGFLKSAPHIDPQLGELRRSRGFWRGHIAVDPGQSVPLVLAGSRAAPEAEALRIARTIASQMAGWRPAIANALHEHYQPYAESVADEEESPPSGGLPKIERPEDVWAWVSIDYIAVTALDGVPAIEIGLRAAWDEEHTLGARLRDGRLLELNGSVLAP